MTEREMFLAVLDLPDAAARTDYLDRVCAGDAARRARIESLLLSHETAASFLDNPAVAPLKRDGLAAGELDGSANSDDANVADDDLKFLDKPRRPDSLGRLGHYEVLQVLGKGGFGIVFRAFDDRLQRVVAIKVIAPQIATLSPARKRFVREARSSASVRHENVVQVYEVGEQPLPYLVMEFIPGETLQQKLDRSGPLETTEALRIGRQIAEGLAAAHACDLIHRDIKPGNILIESGSHKAKITDFGLARAADDASISQSGVIAGTPMFMAPEQAHGGKLDHRADLFSLGSVLYTMCSGRPPFRANSTLGVLKRVAEDTPRPIPEIIPEVPTWLCDLITRLHAKKPEDRFGTAQEVADLLARGLAALQTPAQVPSPPVIAPVAVRESVAPAATLELPKPAPALKPRSHSRQWATATAVFLLLLGGLGFTEAAGVTHFRGTVIRLFSPEGTLVVEVDDPGVSVQIDGSDLVITGAGAKEIRLKPGSYTVEGRKDGKVVSRELVTVTKDNKKVVRVTQEALVKEVNSGGKGPVPKTVNEPTDAAAWERSVAAMPADEQVKAVVARMKELDPGFDATVRPVIEVGVVTELNFNGKVTQVSPVRALVGLKSLEFGFNKQGLWDLSPLKDLKLTSLCLHGTAVTDLSPLKDMKLTSLNLYVTPVFDLSPLRDMPLTRLVLGMTRVTDLSLLKDMELTELHIEHTKVTDLRPLKDMKLTYLDLYEVPVKDLSPLKGMPLKRLWMYDSGVTDLSPLKDMPLETIRLTPRNITQGLEVLRDMKSLKTIGIRFGEKNIWPAAEFWARYDKGQFTTADDPDRRAAEYMLSIGGTVKINEQVKEIRAAAELPVGAFRLTGLHVTGKPLTNAGLASLKDCRNLTWIWLQGLPQVTDEGLDYLKNCKNVTYLQLFGLPVTDAGLAAFKDCTNLETLIIQNAQVGDAGLAHFKACKHLTELNLNATQVGDAGLQHLAGVDRLTLLILTNTKVSDLSPLEGMKLTNLNLNYTQVRDLAPLQGMSLTAVRLGGTPVQDLFPLKGMKLTSLGLDFCANVRDLTPLAGMPLKALMIYGTGVTDLSCLKGVPLQEIRLTPKNITQGLDLLRDMKSLKTIGVGGKNDEVWPAAEFWVRYDRGEFKE